ncbi:hypothetical protein T439DRAFT_118591 [Meredithblackwellia eburnea MCA 4105]
MNPSPIGYATSSSGHNDSPPVILVNDPQPPTFSPQPSTSTIQPQSQSQSQSHSPSTQFLLQQQLNLQQQQQQQQQQQSVQPQPIQPVQPVQKARRAFKACAHCRSRKAKCDLGDLNNPHDPPCTRCRREGVLCEFLPSRRGGRVPFNSQKKKEGSEGPTDVPYRKQPAKPSSSISSSSHHHHHQNNNNTRASKNGDSSDELIDDGPEEVPQVLASSAMGHIGSLSAISINRPHDFSIVPTFPPNEIGRQAFRFPPTIPVPPPISTSDIFRVPRNVVAQPTRSASSNNEASPATGSAPGGGGQNNNNNRETSDASPADTVSDGRASDGSGLGLAQPRPPRKKRRLSEGGPVDPDSLAAASLRNPVDALDLLVLAADGGAGGGGGGGGHDDDLLLGGGEVGGGGGGGGGGLGGGGGGAGSGELGDDKGDGRDSVSEKSPGGKLGFDGEGAGKGDVKTPPVPQLEDFPLVKKGILTTRKLCELVDVFFSRCHFIFPICPYTRVPRTEEQLAKFASQELHLVTVMVVIASRHDRNPRVHDKSWAYLQTLINEIILGKNAGVGAVEALLLLSEYLPRQKDVVASNLNAEENRMSWMLVGTAVRLGYMLGLDQKTLLPAKSLEESTSGTEAEEMLNRERVAWTYCYLFDRQISVRTGKAFWSRGPGLCFTGGAGGVYPTAAKNFPALRFIPEIQDDFASLLQAYVELTQIMTSSHDILYPTKERTINLIRLGEYYKYIDEFQRSLEAFRFTWEGKRWATYPLTECIWITFHYLRLYIYAFAFQAHIQRVTMSDLSDDENGSGTGRRVGNSMFPSGLVASPDAKFILEAIDAAADLLRLVTDRLHPGGALPFLPWRFFMMFSYAGVFLLKAVYVEAVAPLDRTVIVRLLKRLIFVLACASTDEQHPGVRYARLLNGLLRAFSQGQESMSATRAPTPARRNSLSEGQGLQSGSNGNSMMRPDVDFMTAYVGGTSSAAVSPAMKEDQPTGTSEGLFPPTFTSFPSLSTPSFSAGALGAVGATPAPFPMQPFSESQPFQQLANALDSSQDFDFGFEDSELPAPAPAEAFNFLLEDSALTFWNSFSGDGDWIQQGAAGV